MLGRPMKRGGRSGVLAVGVLAVAALAIAGLAAACVPPPDPTPPTTTLPAGNAWTPDTAGTRGHIELASLFPSAVVGRPGGGLVIAAGTGQGTGPVVRALRADGSAEWNHTPADAIGVGPLAAGPSGTTLVAERPTGAALDVAASPDAYDPAPRIVRLLGNGQPDPSFGSGGSVSLTSVPLDQTPLPAPGGDPVPQFRYVSGLTVDGSGRVLVVVRDFAQTQGGFTCAKWGRVFRAYLLRLTPGGQPDPTFNGGAALSLINGNNGCDGRETTLSLVEDRLAVRPDGRIVLHAVADSPLVQLPADGSGLDPTFGAGGSVASATTLPNWVGRNSPVPLGMVLRPGDGSVVFGVANRACQALSTDPPCFSGYLKASSGGVVDPSFSPSGVLSFPSTSSAIMPIDPAGATDGTFRLAGYLPDVTPTGTEYVLNEGELSANGDLVSQAVVDWPLRPQVLLGRFQNVYEPPAGPRQVVDGAGTTYLVGIPVTFTGGAVGPTTVVRLP